MTKLLLFIYIANVISNLTALARIMLTVSITTIGVMLLVSAEYNTNINQNLFKKIIKVATIVAIASLIFLCFAPDVSIFFRVLQTHN